MAKYYLNGDEFGGNYGIGYTDFNVKFDYDEHVIGEMPNGQTLFQKTVKCIQNTGESAWVNFAQNTMNADKLIDVFGYTSLSGGFCQHGYGKVVNGYLQVYVPSSGFLQNDDITVLYTKNGVYGGNTNKFLNQIDYSEEEKVIGTYCGKPLYRRVIKGTFPSSGSTSSNRTHYVASINILNVDTVIATKGIVKLSNGYIIQFPRTVMNSDKTVVVTTYTQQTTTSLDLYYQYDKTQGSVLDVANRPYEMTVEYTKVTD